MIKLSIISITYNDLLGLMRTIASIDKLLDTSSESELVEHVIVDGSSIDGTQDYLNQSTGYRKVKTTYKSEPDNGIYDAMNKGVRKSVGEFVVFLNSGDEIHPDLTFHDLISNLDDIAKEKNVAGLALSAVIKFSRKNFTIHSRALQRFTPRMPTVHQSIFYKRGVLLTIPFDNSYKVCGDYDNFARIFSSGLIFRPSSEIFALFYAGGISSTSPLKLFRESSSISNKYFGLNFPRRIINMLKLLFSLSVVQLFLNLYGIHKNGDS